MASLSNCMECGGIVSSEATQCPHCKTGGYGIQGVKCHVCSGVLKFSEARRINHFEEKSEFFHESCYQQVSRKIVEKKQTINCPVCAQPNQFSYANDTQSKRFSRFRYIERINCAKCGHPYEYKQLQENDPYSNCMYCGFLIENNLEVHIRDKYYAHKVCNTNERQAQEIWSMEYHENNRKKIDEEQRLKKKKEADEKFESKLRGALLPGLFMGGLSLVMGVWAILLFAILFGLYFIID